MRPLLILLAIVLLVAAISILVVMLLYRHVVATTPHPTATDTPHLTVAEKVQDHTAGPSQAAPSLSAHHSAGPVHFRPTLRNRDLQVLDGPYFTIGYDNQRKNPAWVSYDLDGPISHPGPEPTRPGTFQTDFRTSAHVAHHDYSSSGFDRGHMCPAYAMYSRNGSEGFLATFTCSNIIPQPQRNRHHNLDPDRNEFNHVIQLFF